MTRHKSKLLVAFCVALALVLILCGTVIVIADAVSQYKWSGASVEASYAYGTNLNIPVRTIGDGAKVSHSLVYPDGSATYADSVKLNQFGDYQLTYTAKIGSKVYSDKHIFNVANMLYSMGNPASSAVYSTEIPNVREEGNKGIIVQLQEGDTLTFNKAIKVEDLTYDNSIIEGLMLPSAAGKSDFSELRITLTDIENPDIYFTIRATEKSSDSDPGRAYILAGANGQSLTAIQCNPNSNVWTGNIYLNEYGAEPQDFPFAGVSQMGNGKHEFRYENYNDDYPFRFYFDSSTKEIWYSSNYCNPIDQDGNGVADEFAGDVERHKDNIQINSRDYRQCVTDLDNTDYYANIWDGFPSGYAKLTVTCGEYSSPTANFCITKVAGMDISTNSFTIEQSPIITVDAEKDLPQARIGAWYPIPNATAKDMYFGEIEVNTEVVFNYTGSESERISVKIEDGKFMVDRPGYYAIVYTATNDVGISSEQVLYVHASEEVQDIDVHFAHSKVTSGKVLEYIEYADVTFTNGSGSITYSTYAKFGDKIIATEEGFIPDETGTWHVVCRATDAIGQVTEEYYEVVVSANEKCVLLESVYLPKVFISGMKYQLPEVYASKYGANGIEKILCDVSVTMDGKTTQHRAGDIVNIEVENAGDDILVVYSAQGDELLSETISTVKPYSVVQNGNSTTKVLDYAQYFVCTNASGVKTDTGYMLTLGSDNASFYYANPIVAQGIDVELLAPIEKSHYNQVTITLIDANDYSNSIQTVVKTVDGIATLIVGDKSYNTGYQLSAVDFTIRLDYDNGNFVWGENYFPVTETVKGKEFDGFTSGKVYLQVDIDGITEESQLKVVSVRGNYTFKEQTSDMVSPYYVADIPARASINSVLKIPALLCGDIISPGVIATLTVEAPDGSVAKDINGVALDEIDPYKDYSVLLSAIGKYTIRYSIVKDNNFGVRGLSVDDTITIEVRDVIAPEIVLTSGWTKDAKVGDVIICPNFEYKDNHSTNEDILVYVQLVNPTGQTMLVPGNAVQVSYSGTYTWQIIVIDEAGNITIKKIDVTVR